MTRWRRSDATRRGGSALKTAWAKRRRHRSPAALRLTHRAVSANKPAGKIKCKIKITQILQKKAENENESKNRWNEQKETLEQ